MPAFDFGRDGVLDRRRRSDRPEPRSRFRRHRLLATRRAVRDFRPPDRDGPGRMVFHREVLNVRTLRHARGRALSRRLQPMETRPDTAGPHGSRRYRTHCLSIRAIVVVARRSIRYNTVRRLDFNKST